MAAEVLPVAGRVGARRRAAAVAAPGGRRARAARRRRSPSRPAEAGGELADVGRGGRGDALRRRVRRAGRRVAHLRDRAAAYRCHRQPRADRPVGPADAGRGADRGARDHRARRRVRRRLDAHHAPSGTGTRTSSNGAKTFITSGRRADFVTTAVRTGDAGAHGISLLVIEKGTPGFTVSRKLDKMGWLLLRHRRAVASADVRVPARSPRRRGGHRVRPARAELRQRTAHAGRRRRTPAPSARWT